MPCNLGQQVFVSAKEGVSQHHAEIQGAERPQHSTNSRSIKTKQTCETHSVKLLFEALRLLTVLQLGSTFVPLGLAECQGEPPHLNTQLPHIPLQIPHLALPLGLAALQLQSQPMPSLFQLLKSGRKDLGLNK